jgi:hypothetical protein
MVARLRRTVAPMRGNIEIVGAFRVDLFGDLKDSIEPVIQRRLLIATPGSRQRRHKRTYGNLLCAHNKFLYTSAPKARE